MARCSLVLSPFCGISCTRARHSTRQRPMTRIGEAAGATGDHGSPARNWSRARAGALANLSARLRSDFGPKPQTSVGIRRLRPAKPQTSVRLQSWRPSWPTPPLAVKATSLASRQAPSSACSIWAGAKVVCSRSSRAARHGAKLKIPRKDVLAADLEGAHFDGGSFLLFPAPPDESEIEFHLITRGPFGARVGTRDAHGKFSIDDETDHTWLSPTFTACADPTFSNGDVVGLLSLTFAAATGVFICQDQPGVWVVCDAADFMDLAKPSVCLFSQIQDEDHHSLCLPTSVCAALDVQLSMADDADDQWDNPQVAESDAESEVSAEVAVPTVMADFRTGQNGKFEGRFEGSGQKLGTWDVFTAFWSEESSKLMTFWAVLQVVTPGAQHSAILVRILGGKKTGGVRGSEQACYMSACFTSSRTSSTVCLALVGCMPQCQTLQQCWTPTPTHPRPSKRLKR